MLGYLLFSLLLLVGGRAGRAGHREKRFLGADWWSHFHRGQTGLEERAEKAHFPHWEAKVEGALRPSLARLGGTLGDLVEGLVGGLAGPPQAHRREGQTLTTGEHIMGLGELGASTAQLGAELGANLGKFGADLGADLSHQLDHFGPSASSPLFSSTSSFSSTSMGGLAGFDPFSVFGLVRKKWYQGEGVCTEREVLDEEEITERAGGVFGIMTTRTTQCRDESWLHECRTSLTEGGVRKTVLERQVCCHGHRRVSGSIGCEEQVLQPLEDTIKELGGQGFLAMIEDNNLMKHLSNNMTVFLPTEDAVEDFHRDLMALNSLTEDGRGGPGLTSRKRRAPLSLSTTPGLEAILLGHLAPGLITTASMADRGEVEVVSGATIRLTVYNTYPEKTVMANCARITSANEMASNGLVHVVDKVIVPAEKTIAELIRTELDTASFYRALMQANLTSLLESTGQLTVFAPTDAAMSLLEPALREKLLEGGACTADLLSHHILPSVICSGIVEGRLETSSLTSSLLSLSRSQGGEVTVEGARLITRDVVATNGVVHTIDAVLVPASSRPFSSALASRPTIQALLDSTGLTTHYDKLTSTAAFLPTESAMAELPDSFLQGLQGDKKKVQEFLSFHLATLRSAGPLLPSLLKGHSIRMNSYSSGPLAALGGEQVLTAQCARLDRRKEEVCGATVYSVDKVLLPPAGDIFEVISSTGDYSSFLALVKTTNLSSLVTSPGRTLLVPTEKAFSSLSEETLTRLREDLEFAKETVERHLLREVLCCAGIQRNNVLFNSSRKRTASGSLVSIRRSASGHLYADKAEISKCDIMAINGVVHEVDALLLPGRKEDSALERRGQGVLQQLLSWF